MQLIKNLLDENIKVIAVDFDGTLCERGNFPEIGEPKSELIEWLKNKQTQGVQLILWSCRENDDLKAAIRWCERHGIVFNAVNENLPSCPLKTRKIIADLYIDDRACVPIYGKNK